MIKPPLFLSAFLLLASFAFCQTTRVYEETFAPAPGSKSNEVLSGREIGGDGPEWRVDGAVTLVGDGLAGANASGAAWVPLDTGARSVRVRAKLAPSGSDWVALAIGGRWGDAFYDSAQLWVLLRPSADYQIRAEGQKQILRSGKAPSFKREGGNAVEISYDAGPRELTVFINGETVLDRHRLAVGFDPALDSVGFRFNGPFAESGQPSVSHFSAALTGSFPPSLTLRLDEALGVYEPGAAPALRVSGRGWDAKALTVRLGLIDYDQREVWKTSATVKPSDGRLLLEPHPPGPLGPGYYELRCTVEDACGKPLAEARRPLVVIALPPLAARTDENPFGAMVFPHLAYPNRDKELDARYMERIGLRYVRSHRLNWIHIQRAADAPLDWAHADREVEIYRRHGLRIIATTGWPVPAWASSARDLQLPEMKGNFMPAPDSMDAARRFHRELARRYKDDISCFEIGNEVDAHFWLGSAAHYREHDIPGILRDYRDYFGALAGEILAEAPGALVAPSTTGALEGHTYRPWLTTQLELGLGETMTAYSTHYRGDVGYANELFRKHGLKAPPVFLTEIGGFSRLVEGENAFGAEMRRMIREDYLQMVTQLTQPNVRALCKFILREQPTYGGEGTIRAGLLGADFTPRPSYVAYGTLVRALAGARFVERLNLAKSSATGWAEGFAFERDGRRINVLFLHAASPAAVRFTSDETQLSVVDVMGRTSSLTPSGGRAELRVDSLLPVIVVGAINGEPGRAVVPSDVLLKEIELRLENSSFEERVDKNGPVPGWGVMINEISSAAGEKEEPAFSVSVDRSVRREGKQSVRMDAPKPTRWNGITQRLPLDRVPRPGPGEYLIFKVSVQAKGESIHGKGLGYTLALRRPTGERVTFMGSPYFGFGGTYDWKELAGDSRLEAWPEGVDRITLDLLLGLSTGTLWLDDVNIVVQHWRKP